METRWRIPEGKVLSETKVSERIKELYMSKERMRAITQHLSRNERLEAIEEAEEASIAEMKKISAEMTKDWSDSVKQQHAKRQAELESMLNKHDDTNLIKYLAVKKEQEDERNLYVSELRQRLLRREDFPKALGSAYVFSQVLTEREKQKAFAKELKDIEAKRVREEVEDMRADVALYKQEQDEAKALLRAKNLAYAEELLVQGDAVKKAKLKARADKIEEELLDQVRARLEADRIEEVRISKIAAERKRIKDAFIEFRETQAKEKERLKHEEINSELVTKTMQMGRDRMRSLLKAQAKREQEARISKGLSVFDNSKVLKREAELKLMYDNGYEKIMADEQERDKADKEREVRLRQERLDIQAEYLQKREEHLREEFEDKKWEVLHRHKIVEEEEKYNEYLKHKAVDDRAFLVETIDSEVKLKRERLKFDDKAEIREILAKNENDDKKYLAYAQEVRDLAQANEWNTLPIDRVIKKYHEDVIGEKPLSRCERLKEEAKKCTNEAHSRTTAGRRTHCPASDPSVKCKHQKDRLYN